MAKGKRRKIAPDEMIAFRPGAELGQTIDALSKGWGTSRGEASKRLIALGVHGLDTDFYDVAVQLVECLGARAKFEDACKHLHVRIAEVEQQRQMKGECLPLGKPERLEIARETVSPYRFVRQLDQETEKKRLHVEIYLTERS